MPKFKMQFSLVQSMTVIADNVEDAKQMILDDYQDEDTTVEVTEAVEVDMTVTKKAILQALIAAPAPMSGRDIASAISTFYWYISEVLGSLKVEGILLQKRSNGKYFICAAGKEKAQAILG